MTYRLEFVKKVVEAEIEELYQLGEITIEEMEERLAENEDRYQMAVDDLAEGAENGHVESL
jgi:nitrate reductase assembly molybdenum cofactor insertion protein NarJ